MASSVGSVRFSGVPSGYLLVEAKTDESKAEVIATIAAEVEVSLDLTAQ